MARTKLMTLRFDEATRQAIAEAAMRNQRKDADQAHLWVISGLLADQLQHSAKERKANV